jgi:hypothetical protein
VSGTVAHIVKSGSLVALARSLALTVSGLLACACGSGTATETKVGAVIVVAPGAATGIPNYFVSAGFSDMPRLIPAGEFTSLEFGIGEPDGCAKNAVGGCRVFHCPNTIAATTGQGMGPNVGAITITWSPASGPAGGAGLPPPITFSPDSYDLFFWSTATPVTSFGFSAAGAAIPAFPATDVDVPQPFEVTELNGNPLGTSPPRVPRAAGVPVTWTGGTGDALFVLQQRQIGTDNDLQAVCRVAASAGTFTVPSGVVGEFLPGNVSLRASVVSIEVVAAGDYTTTLAIAVPLASRFALTIE